jgi:predicted amidohydrolase YtcJ
MKKNSLLSLLGIILLSSCVKTEQADLVVHNARIYTLNKYVNQAEAMAIVDGKIVEVGDEHEIMNRYQAKEYHDLRKAVVVPGFLDAHAFALRYAWLQNQNNLSAYDNMDDVLRLVSEEGKKGLFIGVNVRPEVLSEKLISYLDYFPELLYVLKTKSGLRMAMSPRMADSLELGSKILDGPEVFEVWERVVDMSTVQTSYDTQLQVLQDSCLKLGIVGISEMASEAERASFLAASAESLKIRLYQSFFDNDSNRNYLFENVDSIGNYQLNALDLYLDEPISSGRSSIRGEDSIHLNYSNSELLELAELANELGVQLIFHCFGDSAVGQVAAVAKEVLKQVNDKRWRIEHCQFMTESDLKALKDFTLLPGMCPQQAPVDLAFLDSESPEYKAKAYPFKKAFEANQFLTAGSAAPLDDLNPLVTFQVMAELLGDEPQAREMALRAITYFPAVAMFMENELGSLEVGKDASFVVLNGDPVNSPSEVLNELRVQRTYLQGTLEYIY